MKPGKSSYRFQSKPQQVTPVKSKFRVIQTPLPHPADLEVIRKISQYESSLLERQLPIVWDRAQGYTVYDRWGNQWIDLSSTIFVANAGHANQRSKYLASKVIQKDLMHAYCYPTVERAEFLEKLINFTPENLEKACLVSTGTEASERAIKLARLYGMQFNPRKKIIVGARGNYHGKTMGAMMAAVTPEARKWIGNQDPDMLQIPFPYPWGLKEMKISGEALFKKHIDELLNQGVRFDEITAFIIESYQGWGAVFYPKDYVQAMKDWTEKNQALLIVDEIQSGFGRTGKLFGYQHYEVCPDLVCCGKGISGSFPLSAVIGKSDLIELDPELTSTHGGHPVCCAAALGQLETLVADDLVNKSRLLGNKLKGWLIDLLRKYPNHIKHIEGEGLVQAIYFGSPESDDLDANFVDKLVERAMQKGVFSVRTGCGTIKIGPPLCIDEEALKEAISVYSDCIEEMTIH
jgi:4-aminobutyrate aminotransferase / (S)-3-amino-2-methylpropionate transaminase / 5-aminovalerate transaminase